MKTQYLFLALTFFFYACGGECPVQKELVTTKADLEQVRSELANLTSSNNPLLVHTVYLKTRPDLTSEELADLTSKLESLSSIEGVIGLGIGRPAATGDPRLNTDYDYVLQMGFASEADLSSYQNNETHIRARETTKSYLLSPPVVFDYWLKTPTTND